MLVLAVALVLAVCGCSVPAPVRAATCTSLTTGLFGNSGTWPGCTTYPQAADTAIVANGATLTGGNSAYTVMVLQMGQTTSSTTVLSPTNTGLVFTTQRLYVMGTATINLPSGATFTVSGSLGTDLFASPSSQLTLGGSGTFTFSSTTQRFDSGTLMVTGSNVVFAMLASMTGGNIVLGASRTATFQGCAISPTPIVTVSGSGARLQLTPLATGQNFAGTVTFNGATNIGCTSGTCRVSGSWTLNANVNFDAGASVEFYANAVINSGYAMSVYDGFEFTTSAQTSGAGYLYMYDGVQIWGHLSRRMANTYPYIVSGTVTVKQSSGANMRWTNLYIAGTLQMGPSVTGGLIEVDNLFMQSTGARILFSVPGQQFLVASGNCRGTVTLTGPGTVVCSVLSSTTFNTLPGLRSAPNCRSAAQQTSPHDRPTHSQTHGKNRQSQTERAKGNDASERDAPDRGASGCNEMAI